MDASDGLRNGAELERPDAGGGQQRGEDHVVARGHADDVVDPRVDPLHQPAAGPPRPEHHHPRLLPAYEGRRESSSCGRNGSGGGGGGEGAGEAPREGSEERHGRREKNPNPSLVDHGEEREGI